MPDGSGGHAGTILTPLGMEKGRRSPQPRTKKIPPPAEGALRGLVANLKAFKELRPQKHNDEKDAGDRLDMPNWFEDLENACWRGRGSGSVLQPWWLDQLLSTSNITSAAPYQQYPDVPYTR